MTHDLDQLLAAKEARRRQLAAAPFPEKVRIVVRLQEIAAPILRQRGRLVRPWRIQTRDRAATPPDQLS